MDDDQRPTDLMLVLRGNPRWIAGPADRIVELLSRSADPVSVARAAKNGVEPVAVVTFIGGEWIPLDLHYLAAGEIQSIGPVDLAEQRGI